MFNGKMKAITFSYDDCTVQDVRLIELFNKYNEGAKTVIAINSDKNARIFEYADYGIILKF